MHQSFPLPAHPPSAVSRLLRGLTALRQDWRRQRHPKTKYLLFTSNVNESPGTPSLVRVIQIQSNTPINSPACCFSHFGCPEQGWMELEELEGGCKLPWSSTAAHPPTHSQQLTSCPGAFHCPSCASGLVLVWLQLHVFWLGQVISSFYLLFSPPFLDTVPQGFLSQGQRQLHRLF